MLGKARQQANTAKCLSNLRNIGQAINMYAAENKSFLVQGFVANSNSGGKGIENYMNDAPADVGIVNNFSNVRTPILGKPLPILGLVGFFDLNWSDKWTSTIGYSRVNIDNTDAQAASAFKSGQYALCNILYYPVKGVMLGPEFQWGYRDNKSAWHVSDYRIQFSAKYSFSFRVGG